MYKYLILVPLFFVIGCSSVPQNASILSEHISVGITKAQEETEKIINTLAEVEFGVLDEKWETIYKDSEQLYRNQEGLSKSDTLSEENRIDIATIAAGHRENILKMIDEKKNALINKTRTNTQKLIGLNETVRKYLLSLEALDKSNQQANELINGIIGVDVKNIIGAAKEAISKLPELK